MNNEYCKRRILDADSLREMLGCSVRFGGKIFCLVIDAEPFKDYDAIQLAHDILLIAHSRNTKIIVVVGCFPTRLSGAKQMLYSQKIIAAARELQKQLANMTVAEISYAKRGEIIDQFLLPEKVPAVLKRELIAVVPAIDFKTPESASVVSVERVLMAIAGAIEECPISKVVIISNCDGVFGIDKGFLAQINSVDMKTLLQKEVVAGHLSVIAETAVYAIENLSIERVHIVNGIKPDSLLLELYTKDGSGTMVYSGSYSEIRKATDGDISGVHSLLAHHADFDMILPHSLDELGLIIGQFLVTIVDDFPIACARLRFYPDEEKAFLSSVAVNPAYLSQGIGLDLLDRVVQDVTAARAKHLSLVSKRTIPYWLPADFEVGDINSLPRLIKEQFAEKNPTVLVKNIIQNP